MERHRRSHFVDDFVTLVVSQAQVDRVGNSIFYTPPDTLDPLFLDFTIIEKPKVPYTGTFRLPLRRGTIIQFRGFISRHSSTFCITLSCGVTEDIALYFAPRYFFGNYVERKSRVRGKWKGLQTAMGQGNPFQRNMNLHMEILTTEAGFLVSVAGRQFVSQKHFVPVHMVDTLQVSGGVELDWIKYRIATEFPEPCLQEMSLYDKEIFENKSVSATSMDFFNYRVPFLGKLTVPFDPGQELTVRGKVNLCPVAFWIHLLDRPHSWPTPNIALSIHTDYICTRSYDTEIVLNYRYNGHWGKGMKRIQYDFFEVDTDFCVTISAHDLVYYVKIDDKLLGIFEHHRDGDQSLLPINTIEIRGCVQITDVSVVKWKFD